MKSQILEKKIEGEINDFETFHKICFLGMIIMILVYIVLKAGVLFHALKLSGHSKGFSQALMKVDQINAMGPNNTNT